LKPLAEQLEQLLGPGNVVTGSDVAERDPGWYAGNLGAEILVTPRDTAGVSAVLELCNRVGRTVVPHGGLTGCVFGTVSRPGDVIVSLEKMNAITAISPTQRTIDVEAGAILQNVQERADQHGLMFPLDISARGSCTIGGNIASNAGGNRVIRYGMTRQLVLGLEAVLADGTVISSMNASLKNNSGYDLKQLFIGCEGTLGIVTKAVLRLFEKPSGDVTALAAVADFDDVVTLLKRLDGALDGTLSSFEVMWHDYYAATVANMDGAAPFADDHSIYVLIEALVSNTQAVGEVVEQVLGEALEAATVKDAVIAKSQSERDRLWRIRDDYDVIEQLNPTCWSYDVSLPVSEMDGYVATVRVAVAERLPGFRIYTFGHVGDGNIHFNIGCDEPDAAGHDMANDIVYEPLQALGGSISAEHGIGLEKKAYLALCRSPQERDLMRLLKNALDPKGTLNPGKIFD
jgi:FAD/FMN-containing dehydrogenase